jgi:hypothetical protein
MQKGRRESKPLIFPFAFYILNFEFLIPSCSKEKRTVHEITRNDTKQMLRLLVSFRMMSWIVSSSLLFATRYNLLPTAFLSEAIDEVEHHDGDEGDDDGEG